MKRTLLSRLAILSLKWGIKQILQSDGYNENRKEYVKRMEEEGFIVVYPSKNEIQIDVDSEIQDKAVRKQMEVLLREEGDLKVIETESKGGYPGKHYRIFFERELSDIERIAFQAAMGSDPVRELLSLFRLHRGDDFPTLLVEKPCAE